MKKFLLVTLALLLVIAIGCSIWYYSTYRYNLGLYSIDLLEVTIVDDAAFDRKYIVAHYIFTNYSNEPVSFSEIIDHHAYQKGVELFDAWFIGAGTNIEHWANKNDKVLPGVAIEVDVPYYIVDEEEIVTFQVYSPDILWWRYVYTRNAFPYRPKN